MTAPPGLKKRKLHNGNDQNPTVNDIISDSLTPIAQKYWAPGGKLAAYDAKVVDDIYYNELINKPEELSRRLIVLELSGYLENYLWKHFDVKKATHAHVMSILFLVNAKFSENLLQTWRTFHEREEVFVQFLDRVFKLFESSDWQKKDKNGVVMREKNAHLVFLIHCNQSLEDATIRKCFLRLISLPLWKALSPSMLKKQLKLCSPDFRKRWNMVLKAGDKIDEISYTFFPTLIQDFFRISSGINQDNTPRDEVLFCERFLEFVVDLLAQLPTRRFFHSLLQDLNFVVRCRLSSMVSDDVLSKSKGRLFGQMLQRVIEYHGFEIDDQTGQPLTDDAMLTDHYADMVNLQRVCFKHFRDVLEDLSLASVQQIDSRESLLAHLKPLNAKQLRSLCVHLEVLDENSSKDDRKHETVDFLKEILVQHLHKRQSQKDKVRAMPLYPEETILWDENVVPTKDYRSDQKTLALPKLNLQFLTLHDYVLRNFQLYRLESTYQIREDLTRTVLRLQPRLNEAGTQTMFTGWSRMATTLQGFKITKVQKPNIGELNPAQVQGEATINLGTFQGQVREEWSEIKPYDVLFLMTIRANTHLQTGDQVVYPQGSDGNGKKEVKRGGDCNFFIRTGTCRFGDKCRFKHIGEYAKNDKGEKVNSYEANKKRKRAAPDHDSESDEEEDTLQYAAEQWEDANVNDIGVVYVRGCIVDAVLDEDGEVVGARNKDGKVHRARGNKRTYRVNMDPAQYQLDMNTLTSGGAEDCYTTFNVILRRKPKENNFRQILDTIRNIMLAGDTCVPTWLHDVFLGYGAPDSCQYHQLKTQPASIKFNDTFLDKEHLQASFPGTIEFENTTDELGRTLNQEPPFEISIKQGVKPDFEAIKALPIDGNNNEMEDDNKPTKKLKKGKESKDKTGDTIQVKSYAKGVMREKQVVRNQVRFTPMQVEAIKSALQPGLTMIVGPPGTGKTDVAVQAIAEMYHNFPEQRILLITHSNQALNDLFEKLLQRDIDERYMLRLGRGQELLASAKDFSKWGRVNLMLERRLIYLDEVCHLAKSLSMSDDAAYTCETAYHFNIQHIVCRWDEYCACFDAFRAQVQSKKLDYAKECAHSVVPIKVPVLGKSEDAKKGQAVTLADFIRLYFPFTRYFVRDQTRVFDLERQTIEDEKLDVVRGARIAEKEKKKAAKTRKERGEDEENDMDDDNAAAEKQAQDDREASWLTRELDIRQRERNLHSFLFPKDALHQDWKAIYDVALQCYRTVKDIFVQLDECRPFELLRTGKDRGNFILTHQAKVIAMTCTHAGIMRGQLLDLKFQYDNLVMEEAGQVLDIETFIPMVLQAPDPEFGNRLKRVILVGDHMQLPPVIKNRSFQKFSNLDQSLFARYVRLGVPYIQLNAQGRMRASLANLWNWRYDNLGNLSFVDTDPRFRLANAGFTYDYQFIDVPDYDGVGESAPTANFTQNLGEAEYVVQMYMYMRLLGYPRQKISIITSYNGQKSLIRDVIAARCKKNPLYGEPARITTVDKFQGQQNDYILLSLVRTKNAGHIRDIRRLIVAMSRARLGLYIFGRSELFRNCYELTQTFNILLQRPTQLMLVQGERSSTGTTERLIDMPEDKVMKFPVTGVEHMGQIVLAMQRVAEQEYATYQAHWRKQEEEEERQREAMKDRYAQITQAKENASQQELNELNIMKRDQEHARITEAMNQELALENENTKDDVDMNDDEEDDDDN